MKRKRPKLVVLDPEDFSEIALEKCAQHRKDQSGEGRFSHEIIQKPNQFSVEPGTAAKVVWQTAIRYDLTDCGLVLLHIASNHMLGSSLLPPTDCRPKSEPPCRIFCSKRRIRSDRSALMIRVTNKGRALLPLLHQIQASIIARVVARIEKGASPLCSWISLRCHSGRCSTGVVSIKRSLASHCFLAHCETSTAFRFPVLWYQM